MIGVILAGGRGSRLGPMAAQISKALVSVGQRPHVISQIELLTRSGCTRVIVVTSPDNDVQVAGLLDRAGYGTTETIMQDEPAGPVNAIMYGLSGANRDDSCIVLMSDTMLNMDTLPSPDDYDPGWVALEEPEDADRSWCFWSDDKQQYIDAKPEHNELVTIGAYGFKNVADAVSLCAYAYFGQDTAEVPMSYLLNVMEPIRLNSMFKGWQDIGDMKALVHARRQEFIARENHKLVLNEDGTITKFGSGQRFKNEMDWLRKLSSYEKHRGRRVLFPQLLENTDDSYTTEFIDLPTLSELWLYWPGKPQTWFDIVSGIIDRLGQDLWTKQRHASRDEIWSFFGGKTIRRLAKWNKFVLTPEREMLITKASQIIGTDVMVNGHGDLNFNNILYSVNSGTFKLVDPRGGGHIPLIYEYAKLGYSIMFAPITHDLIGFDCELLPERTNEGYAVIASLVQHVEEKRLVAAMALILLSATPLHSSDQADALFAHGEHLLRKVTTV